MKNTNKLRAAVVAARNELFGKKKDRPKTSRLGYIPRNKDMWDEMD